MRLWPQTLLWRTFPLVAGLMLASVLAWFQIYTYYAREPRARQSAQLVTSVVNMTQAALIAAQPDKRYDLLLDLSEREGIRVYPAEKDENVVPLSDQPLFRRIAEEVRNDLGLETRFADEVDGEPGFWVSFRIVDDEYWVVLPRERLEQTFPAQWLGWGAAALVLSLAGAYLIVFRISRPLKALSAAARTIGRGEVPPPLDESGPTELATVSHAFNQMSHDLARLDADRALILAGISHDLRTPLARLRLGVEMSAADESAREEMNTDIEDMDRIIDQFLDFARESSGEPLSEVDPNVLAAEVAEPYLRRGVALELLLGKVPKLALREQAVRRALTNLIENALRYAAGAGPITLRTQREGAFLLFDVLDLGPGIPADQAARLKRPFTRLDAARSNASGAGLGLAIVDRIARGHGGAFDLLGREGAGLVARIRLPLHARVTPDFKG